ncbi:aminopeptidase [Biostraticola tofi]|uniref:Alkaline phosphatase isozyme conversion protein n=1 Tax=Biostraticola tofi TaxID=466109 RepID=A0A4R3Z288_9GAMM|nr:aminopeptidase [Biostraticola tofi]TCV99226.1 alkaline phosphatase isozyme conversion protein [Biostraticola tofi]
MCHPGRIKRAFMALCVTLVLPQAAKAALPSPGSFAEQQTRYIATYFPGRMAGSPVEQMAADYLHHQFEQLGYLSNLRAFNTRYRYSDSNGKADWRRITSTSVIAANAGQSADEILVIAHADTFLPHSDKEVNSNFGGLTLQGVDDNAAGVGIMLSLARQMAGHHGKAGLRFVALSAGEPDIQGAEDYLQRMTPYERQHTLLVINLDSLVAGQQLKMNFHPGAAEDRAATDIKKMGAMARKAGIGLLLNTVSAKVTECPTNALPFIQAGFSVLDVSSGMAGKDCRQRKTSRHFPLGGVRYQSQRDSLAYLDQHLSGQITVRTRDSMRLLEPLLVNLTGHAAKI